MKIQIETTDNSWIVTQRGKPTKVFFIWIHLVAYLEDILTNKQTAP